MVLLAGGDAPDGGATDAVELFWLDGGAWLANLSTRQREPSGAVDDDGGLVLLGCGFPGSGSLDLYDPAGALEFDNSGSGGVFPLPSPVSCELGQITWVDTVGAWVIGDGADGGLFLDSPYKDAGSWSSTGGARTSFGAVPSGNGLLQFGGLVAGVPQNDYEIYFDAGLPQTDALLNTARADFGWLQLPNGGGVLVVGGFGAGGSPLASGELFDPQNPELASQVGSMANARIHPAVADISGYGAALVVSGERDGGQPVAGLEIYTY
jgi:hypothetical protein